MHHYEQLWYIYDPETMINARVIIDFHPACGRGEECFSA